MFVRFRQTPSRLQLSLIETRRADGKVRHEHVASLGSIILAPSVADRIAFWSRLHERLAKLSNRISLEVQGKILGEVHARVPMVTPDEQRALQLENAKRDADQWSAIRDLNASTATDNELLVAKASEVITSGKAKAADADAEVKAAQSRIEAIQRGETVEGGLGESEDFAAILKRAGLTNADLRHNRLLALIPKEHWQEFFQDYWRARKKIDRRLTTRAARAILRKYGEG